MVPGCHLVFGFAPGASATKQLLTFCECQWDLFCSGPLAPAAPLADSGAALEPWLMRGGQLELQCQSRQVPQRALLLPRHRDTFKELAGTLATSFLKYLSGRARKIPLCLLLCGA